MARAHVVKSEHTDPPRHNLRAAKVPFAELERKVFAQEVADVAVRESPSGLCVQLVELCLVHGRVCYRCIRCIRHINKIVTR